MKKNASVVGWLRGTLKLRGANKQVGEAIQKGLKYEKAISPNLKKSIATEYTGALKNVYTAEQTMKHESAGMFGAKNFIENMKANVAQKFVKPTIKKGPGRPTVDPKLKKGAPKQTAGRVNKTETTPEGGVPLSKKYPLKGMAIAGAGGYVGGKFFQSGSDNEYEYPKYGSVGSSVGKLLKGVSAAIKNKYVLGAGAVGLGTGLTTGAILDDGHDKSDHGRKKTAGVKTILKGINRAFEAVGKKLPTSGTVKVRGFVIQPKGRNIVRTVDTKVSTTLSKLESAAKKGTSATIGLGKKNTRVHIVKRDVPKELRRINNELKQRNTSAGKLVVGTGALGIAGSGYLLSKRAEDMTPKEKADQKYSIAKSYEKDNHPKKAKEYKNKAAIAYKKAWESSHGK